MFNYRRADQLDLWKENTPYVFVRLIKQLNCSLNIIRTNNCRKSIEVAITLLDKILTDSFSIRTYNGLTCPSFEKDATTGTAFAP